jgi:hypothetical protein
MGRAARELAAVFWQIWRVVGLCALAERKSGFALGFRCCNRLEAEYIWT